MKACGLCGIELNEVELPIGICQDCELEWHGCATGDCQHEKAIECKQTLELLQAEQRARN